MQTQSKVKFYPTWCKKCGICVSFCPKKALEFDDSGYPFLRDSDSCNICGLCVLRCPDFAVVIDKGERSITDSRGHPEIRDVAEGADTSEIPTDTGK
jgi:2-oxoglutarate ferredoxin oxidoreductase subunit delta